MLARLDSIIAALKAGIDVPELAYVEAICESHLVSNAVIVVDMESWSIVYATTPAEQLYGYIRRGLIGKQLNDLVPEEHREAHAHHLQRFRKNPRPRQMGTGDQELRGLKANGETFRVEIGLDAAQIKDRDCAIAIILERRDQEKPLDKAHERARSGTG